jgi:hypothetical protein
LAGQRLPETAVLPLADNAVRTRPVRKIST